MSQLYELEKKQPAMKVKAGAIHTTIWDNVSLKEGKEVAYKTVSLERVYKDKKTDQWKSTNTFRTNDVPKAIVALQKAYEFLILKETHNGYTEEEVI